MITTGHGLHRTAEAGTRTQYVLYVGPWGQAALRLRLRTQHVGLVRVASPYGTEAPGASVSAEYSTVGMTHEMNLRKRKRYCSTRTWLGVGFG